MTEDSSNVNIPLLRKAVEWVEEQEMLPEIDREWNQSAIINPAESYGRSCGTCYCVAGYVANLVQCGSADEATALDVAGEALVGPDWTHRIQGLFWSCNTAEDVRRIAEAIAGERL